MTLPPRAAAVAGVALLAAGAAPAQDGDAERRLLIACLDGSDVAAVALPEAEAAAAGYGDAAAADFEERIGSLEREAEALSRELERDLAEVRRLCADAPVIPGETPEASQPLEAELAAVLERQAAHVERACAAADPGAARSAEALAARLRERIDRVLGGPAAPAPEPQGLEGLRERIGALAAEVRAALARHGRAAATAGRVAALLAPCVGRGESSPEVADLLARLEKLEVRVASGSVAALEVLGRRARALAAVVEAREREQAAARACLAAASAAPGEGDHARRLRRSELERLAAEAEAAARRARSCADDGSRQPGREAEPAALRPLPDVVGLPEIDARTALAAAGFAVLVEAGGEPPRPEAAGTVARQSPPAGAELRAGARVTIAVFSRDD